MTIDLGDGKSITVNAFQGKLWVTVRANGGGITVAADPKDGEEFGLSSYCLSRRMRRLSGGD